MFILFFYAKNLDYFTFSIAASSCRHSPGSLTRIIPAVVNGAREMKCDEFLTSNHFISLSFASDFLSLPFTYAQFHHWFVSSSFLVSVVMYFLSVSVSSQRAIFHFLFTDSWVVRAYCEVNRTGIKKNTKHKTPKNKVSAIMRHDFRRNIESCGSTMHGLLGRENYDDAAAQENSHWNIRNAKTCRALSWVRGGDGGTVAWKSVKLRYYFTLEIQNLVRNQQIVTMGWSGSGVSQSHDLRMGMAARELRSEGILLGGW